MLDSATLYYRAFHALPTTMTAPDGTPNNAVRGFFDALAGLVTRLQPTHLVCAWDADWRPQFRVDLWPGYKTHRLEPTDTDDSADTVAEQAPDDLAPQVDVIARVLDELRICRIGVAGFEADDVIATICLDANKAKDIPVDPTADMAVGMPVDIVTSDRDLLQCVDDARGVRLVSIARGLKNLTIFDEAAVRDRYGIRPQQYVDFATLRGDPSDGLPGVPGVGEKTAAALIRDFGSLAAVMHAAAHGGSPESSDRSTPASMKPSVRTRIRAVSDTLEPLARVSTAVTEVPLPPQWQRAAVLPSAAPSQAADICVAHGVSRQRTALATAGVIPH